MEPGQDRMQLLPEMQEHQHLSNSSRQQVFPPPPVSPPLPSPPQSSPPISSTVPRCFKKTQGRRRVGLEKKHLLDPEHLGETNKKL